MFNKVTPTLALLGAAVLTLPAMAQNGSTLKSLVATHGSISAGDLTFSNFQTPSTLPFLIYGSAPVNDGSDIQVTAITTPSGAMGLQFTAINPATGQPQVFGVDVSPGGRGGGGGNTLPGSLARNVTFDVLVTNPQRLLASADSSFGPGTTTFAGGGVFTFSAGAVNFTYSLDPVTNGPTAIITDQFFATADSKYPMGGSPLPGGYLRSFRFGSELFMGGNPRWGGISTGICQVDYYTVTFATVSADTPPPVVDSQLAYLAITGTSGGSPTTGGVYLNNPAQAGGVVVNLSSDNPGLLTIPAAVSVPQGGTTGIFTASTSPVASDTYVASTATLNGKSFTSSTLIYAAPPLALSYVAAPPVSTAGPVQAMVGLTTPTLSSSVTVALSSNNPLVTVPSSVTIPLGASTAFFPVSLGTLSSLSQLANATITATYAGGSAIGAVTLTPRVIVNLITVEYWTKSKKLNLLATVSAANQTLSYGTNLNGPGMPMTLSGGAYTFKTVTSMSTAPTVVVIWVGSGGMVAKPVTLVDK